MVYSGTTTVFVLLLLSVIFPVVSANAARYTSGQTDYVVGVEKSITVTLPKENISFMAEPGAEEVEYRSVEVGIWSNITNGVKVGMTTSKVRTSDEDLTASGLNSIHGNTIPTLTSPASSLSFPVNHWGYSLDGVFYYGMPAANENMVELTLSEGSTHETKEIRVGTKVDASLPLDYYYGTINFTVVTSYAPTTIEDILYMQEMNGDVAATMGYNKQYRLRDARDNKEYWVTRLVDDSIWMTQDLDLVLSPDVALNQETTDIKRTLWTPPTGTTDFDRNINATISGPNATYYKTPGDTSTGVTVPAYGRTMDDCLNQNLDNPKFCNHFKEGQTYTFAQALASDSNSDLDLSNEDGLTTFDESICPKGWRLPEQAEFPRAASTTQNTLNENDEVIMSISLPATLVREPYYLGNFTYHTSQIRNGYYEAVYPNPDYYYNTPISSADYKIRCVARLDEELFTIKYDLNGGEGITPPDEVGRIGTSTYDFMLSDMNVMPYKEGYSFVGWSTDPEATVPEYIPANFSRAEYYNALSLFTATERETTLYAVWEPAYAITIHANGGSFNDYVEGSGDTSTEKSFLVSVPRTVTDFSTRVREYSSENEPNNNRKDNIYEAKTFVANHLTNTPGYSGYATKFRLTVYYAIPDDVVFCFTKSRIDDMTFDCTGNQVLVSRIGANVHDTVSSRFLHKEVYEFTSSSSFTLYPYFRTSNTNVEGGVNWYGFYAELESISNSRQVQYIRKGDLYTHVPVRAGYEFLGWSTDPNATVAEGSYGTTQVGGTALNPTYEHYVRVNEDIDLYAAWRKYPSFTISLTTNDPEHVNIDVPSIEWNAESGQLYIYYQNDGRWYYYDRENSTYVYVASISASQDDFYVIDVPTSTTPSYPEGYNLYTVPEGSTVPLVLQYSETPATTMQQLTTSGCAAAPVGMSRQLPDARDGKVYWISKLADGACWMTQNLDLELTPGTYTVVPTTSGDQSIYTETTWDYSNNQNVNNYFDGGDYYYANGYIPTSTEGLADNAEEWHYHRGSLYNYHAAKYLCQTGSWKFGDYVSLLDAYQINQPLAFDYQFRNNQALFQAPLYFIMEDQAYSVPRPEGARIVNGNYTYTDYWSSIYRKTDINTSTSYLAVLSLDLYTNPNTSESVVTGNTNVGAANGGFVRCMVK